MEAWSFPPRYDPNYLPDPDSRYWFEQRETMAPGDREKAIIERLREVMFYAYERAPFYRHKWDEAGVHPDSIGSLEDFEDKVPVVTKQELRESQSRCAPFGDYLCIDESEIYHIHGTSGTTGRPTAFAIGRDDWHAVADNHARVMWSAGLRPGDLVFIAAVFDLYIGSWGILMGAERMGAASFPFGAGGAGTTARAVKWLSLMKPKGFYGMPSYALRLAEVAQEEGCNPRDFQMKIMMCSGEPGGSIPSIRDRIQELFGAKVIDCGTMAEMTPWLSACGNAQLPTGMILWQDMIYHEVCDPKTYRRVPYGQRGTPVYTHLERTSQPMIRLASGDLTHWTEGPSPCGRTYPILPDGIYGRIDDMFLIRGENVYPSTIDAVLNELPNYGGEHRIIVTRQGAMDELVVRLEAKHECFARGEEAIGALSNMASRNLKRTLGVRTKVEVVDAKTFPRTEHKARRVIDDRDLFRTLNAQLES